MKRIEKNDAFAMCEMSRLCYQGLRDVQQNLAKGMGLLTKAAELGFSEAFFLFLGRLYEESGDLKSLW